LARLLFHELAHQVVYVQDDTLFNESFATAVERLGGERWLAAQGSDAARREYVELDSRRRQFRALAQATRRRLAAIYESKVPESAGGQALLAMKAIAMADFRADYARLKNDWGGFAGYDAWVAGANNAAFGAQAVYDDWVPAFESLFEREGGNWPAFYDAVRRLAQMSAPERARALKHMTTKDFSG
jgi:predicted aminopeptidase